MPLLHSKSKKAFEKNVKTEMRAHPDKRAQDLAIAYSVKRKAAAKKKMAEGGEVTISAKTEKRPMPNDVHGDSHTVSRNSGNRRPGPDSWTDNPTIKQAQKPSVTALSQPRMVDSSVLTRKLRTQEGDLMDSEAPASPNDQPDSDYDGSGAKRTGPDGPKRGLPHSTKMQPYTKEVEHDDTEDRAEADMKLAHGGEIESSDYETWNANHRTSMEPADHGIQEEEREDEADLQSSASPSEDEGTSDADSRNEEGPNRQGDEVPDMEDQHNSGRKPYYMGGPAVKKDHPHLMFEYDEENLDHDMELNPAHDKHSPDDSENDGDMVKRGFYNDDFTEDDGEPNSIAAAIMSKRKGVDSHVGSESDTDKMARMAEGGKILSHGSYDSDDSSEVDLSRNHDEDANEEDQMSFDALRKENYNDSNLNVENPEDSAQTGDPEERASEDSHDMVEEIRRSMKQRRSRR